MSDWPLGLGVLITGGAVIGLGSGVVDVSVKAILVVVGLVFELVGLVLAVYPDLSIDWFYRMIGIPRPTRLTPGTVPLHVRGSDVVTVTTSENAAITTEEQIAALKEKTAALEGEVRSLKAEVASVRREWLQRLNDASEVIELTFRHALNAKLEEYRSHRIVGFILLVVGLLLSTLVNLPVFERWADGSTR